MFIASTVEKVAAKGSAALAVWGIRVMVFGFW
jgi:hypothetical protein